MGLSIEQQGRKVSPDAEQVNGGWTAGAADDDSPAASTLPRAARSTGRLAKLLVAALVFCLLMFSAAFARWELRSSTVQATLLHNLAKQLTYAVGAGQSKEIRYPGRGPYDLRYGYALLPGFIERLKARSYVVTAQARISDFHSKLVDWGIFPIYQEKTQAGLRILDSKKSELLKFQTPETVYRDFKEIPKILVDTLLFIEDRDLLDASQPRHNPAVEWDRFAKAITDLVLSRVDERHVQGGSTLATQIEKFRHSPEGITGAPREKLRQMFTAAIRAYMSGEENLDARRKVLLDYVNSVPLAAAPGYGEVNGLGDGLAAYYGRELKEVNSLLGAEFSEGDIAKLARQAVAYWQVLSLFLAHRRPTDYLGAHPQVLTDQIAVYLPLLYRMGVIPRALYETANKAHSRIRRAPPETHPISFTERKGLNVIRSHLLNVLGLGSLYELDRLDLTVHSTLDDQTQQAVTKILSSLRDPEYARRAGLEGFRMLDRSGDPGKVIYSFTLWERGPQGNQLRVQTDNYDQPLDINGGVKLDLGSTAKLRTLITYLEVIEALHTEYAGANAKALAAVQKSSPDPLTQWAVDYLSKSKDKRLLPMLNAAMERKYSASPAEAFFTAGGLHTFKNFKPEDDHRIVTLREAIRHSINLPFIRLMRDIVRYYSFATFGSTARTLKDMEEMDRMEYLRRFADKEGQVFLGRYYSKYAGKGPEEIQQILLEGVRRLPRRFAAVFWAMNPDADMESFSRLMKQSFDDIEFSAAELEKMRAIYGKKEYSLADRSYLARVHPLEIWLAGYLMRNPKATYSEAAEASSAVRQEVYEWLFKTRYRHAQDKRIRMMLEAEAFTEIHRQWQKLGYPLRSLVPSYATALGTSADRPEALAELMGIVINDGKRLPMLRVQRLEFAAGTPYETTLEAQPTDGQQVLNPEIAALVRSILIDIVENGTAIRLRGGFSAGGKHFPVGGKTGTGDHRYKVFGKGLWLKEARVVNRTATFMFMIGDRFFGTLTAFVRGPDAAKFGFTSALPVQLLKILQPALTPLLEEAPAKAEPSTAPALEPNAAPAGGPAAASAVQHGR